MSKTIEELRIIYSAEAQTKVDNAIANFPQKESILKVTLQNVLDIYSGKLGLMITNDPEEMGWKQVITIMESKIKTITEEGDTDGFIYKS